MELGPEDVSLLERCLHFRGGYVQASMELGLEDVSLLERCPHFRGGYVQASMELGPEDVSLLERCPHCVMYRVKQRLSVQIRQHNHLYVHMYMYINPHNYSLLIIYTSAFNDHTSIPAFIQPHTKPDNYTQTCRNIYSSDCTKSEDKKRILSHGITSISNHSGQLTK